MTSSGPPRPPPYVPQNGGGSGYRGGHGGRGGHYGRSNYPYGPTGRGHYATRNPPGMNLPPGAIPYHNAAPMMTPGHAAASASMPPYLSGRSGGGGFGGEPYATPPYAMYAPPQYYAEQRMPTGNGEYLPYMMPYNPAAAAATAYMQQQQPPQQPTLQAATGGTGGASSATAPERSASQPPVADAERLTGRP
eukprot:ctg_5127.g435